MFFARTIVHAVLIWNTRCRVQSTSGKKRKFLSEGKLNRDYSLGSFVKTEVCVMRVVFFLFRKRYRIQIEVIEPRKKIMKSYYAWRGLLFFFPVGITLSRPYLTSVVPLTARHGELLNTSKKSNYLTSLRTRGGERVSRSNLCHRRRGNGFFQK